MAKKLRIYKIKTPIPINGKPELLTIGHEITKGEYENLGLYQCRVEVKDIETSDEQIKKLEEDRQKLHVSDEDGNFGGKPKEITQPKAEEEPKKSIIKSLRKDNK